MILTKAHDTATLSNVGEVTSFTIKATAKSFRILSDGLYSNKIRAVVRELSCNAYDSHIAAGKPDLPFDVHLPNSLEPWFVIRDYGVGLNNEEVINIFTTFFESTKTESNDFVGALGLGSKSPFSYTDSFTVTAVKDGVKRVYTAFISDNGTPSVALMAQDETTDPTGVEIHIAVADKDDFSSFRRAAEQVYTYFKTRPVVSGNDVYNIEELRYKSKSIIPGVHYTGNHSVAIMGNICYPIDSRMFKDRYRHLLDCGLSFEFNIGEVDFQASREALSYIPLTINAIQDKIDKVVANLESVVETELNAIDNDWKKALFLYDKVSSSLWKDAVISLIEKNNYPFIKHDPRGWEKVSVTKFNLSRKNTEQKYNITIKEVFTVNKHSSTCHTVRVKELDKTGDLGHVLQIANDVSFVFNDTKVGAVQRAKYHWKKTSDCRGTVVVLDTHDKSKPVLLAEFYNSLLNPPSDVRYLASNLMTVPKKASSRTKSDSPVSIVSIQEKSSRGWSRATEFIWQPAGQLEAFSDTSTYYYVGLKGFEADSIMDPKELCRIFKQANVVDTIYGIRKADIEQVKGKSNWVHVDDFIKTKLKEITTGVKFLGIVKSTLDISGKFCYDVSTLPETSPYKQFVSQFSGVPPLGSYSSLIDLCEAYNIKAENGTDSVKNAIKQYKITAEETNNRYPLLDSLNYYDRVGKTQAVMQYINLIDQHFINNQEGK